MYTFGVHQEVFTFGGPADRWTSGGHVEVSTVDGLFDMCISCGLSWVITSTRHLVVFILVYNLGTSGVK